MRRPYVHEAELELAPDADERAPGGAVTSVLCGHWEHDGACRWPHHTAVGGRIGRAVTVRTVFAVDADEERHVRELIVGALRVGHLEGPTGASRWTVRHDAAASVDAEDAALAERLASTPRDDG